MLLFQYYYYCINEQRDYHNTIPSSVNPDRESVASLTGTLQPFTCVLTKVCPFVDQCVPPPTAPFLDLSENSLDMPSSSHYSVSALLIYYYIKVKPMMIP